MNIDAFQELVWQKGRELYRPMPWRDDTRPYYVLVSEIMLQQTQVERVIPKFEAFISKFPSLAALAAAPLADVLRLWNGLGYNRRAKFLWEAARLVQADFSGALPQTLDELVRLPGVGPNTAGALLAYSFNQPVVFVETNIRTVYFYHFFQDEAAVTDRQLRERVTQTLDTEHPREWYWALMDYGAALKRMGAGANKQSAHYVRQAPLRGSVREVRGFIVKQLSVKPMTAAQLRAAVQADKRFESALDGLLGDGIVAKTAGKLHLGQ